jgi:hypothetical protein
MWGEVFPTCGDIVAKQVGRSSKLPRLSHARSVVGDEAILAHIT